MGRHVTCDKSQSGSKDEHQDIMSRGRVVWGHNLLRLYRWVMVTSGRNMGGRNVKALSAKNTN